MINSFLNSFLFALIFQGGSFYCTCHTGYHNFAVINCLFPKWCINYVYQGGQGCFDIDECSIAEGVSRHFSDHCQKNSFSSPSQHRSWQKNISLQALFALSASSKWQLQINYCGQNTNCNNWPGNLLNNRLLNFKKTEIVVHGKKYEKSIYPLSKRHHTRNVWVQRGWLQDRVHQLESQLWWQHQYF